MDRQMTSDATGFDSGDKFRNEAEVRAYFTVANIAAMLEECPQTQAELDAMAREVIANHWHCTFDGGVTCRVCGFEVAEDGDSHEVECGYCAHFVACAEIPDQDDDAAWAEVADHHADDCEWVQTRAHRVSWWEIRADDEVPAEEWWLGARASTAAPESVRALLSPGDVDVITVDSAEAERVRRWAAALPGWDDGAPALLIQRV